MGKFYFACVFLLGVVFVKTTFAQAPAISYPTPQTLVVGTPIKPILPTNTGGAVPNEIYSKVNTVAGSGYYGYKDTIASVATFENPIGITSDSNGNIYITDANVNAIRKITPTGVVTTIAGNKKPGAVNGQDTSARFQYPTGIAVDNTGNIYVADFVNSLIRKITPSGLVSTFAGSTNSGLRDGAGTNAKFNLPYALAFDKNGILLVADAYNHCIRSITPGGVVTTIAGTGQSGRVNGLHSTASFNVPISIATDSKNNIYVADQNNSCVRKIKTNGVVSTITDTIYKRISSITIDRLDRIYISTLDTFNITQIDTNGKQIGSYNFSGGTRKATVNSTDTLTRYKGGMGLAYDGNNNILISDPAADLIRKVAVNGYSNNISQGPRLPDGLSIDGTGAITGTPTRIYAPTDYTITAFNNNGFNTTTINLSVQTAPQTITFGKLPAVTYGDKNFYPGAISTDTIIPIHYTSSDLKVATIVKDSIHIVGAGTCVVTATQDGNANYLVATPAKQTLTVTKAVLTITADDKIKTAGKDNPALTINYKGFVNKDDTTALITKPIVNTAVIASTAAGSYPITVSGAAAANYSFLYVNGNFVVFPVPVIASIGSTTILKGDSVLLSATPSTGYTYQWLFNGVNINGATASTYYAKQTGAYVVSITANSYTTYSLYTPVISELKLPVDNFQLQVTSITCKGSNNGLVNITAKQNLSYTAVLTGNSLNKSYPFTTSLAIPELSPGNYSICISVDGEIYNQCYQVTISEPKDLSVYSTVNQSQGTLKLQLYGGHTFNITLNDINYSTTQNEITLPLSARVNKLMVTTDKLCQGTIEKTIILSDKIIPYPNPVADILNVNIGNELVNKVSINVIGLINGKSVLTNQYLNQTGVMQLDLSSLPAGLYYLNLNLDNRLSGYKIIKK